MDPFHNTRIFRRNQAEPNAEGGYVLYWMQINRRFHYNFALEFAVEEANRLRKPLLILEAFSCDYPWASDRTHTFVMQGMAEHWNGVMEGRIRGVRPARVGGGNRDYGGRWDCGDRGDRGDCAYYLPFVEEKPGQYERLLMHVISGAAMLVTDEYPVFIMKERNKRFPTQVTVPYVTVDSNGLIPLGMTEKDPYSAYLFRKTMQRHFVESFTRPPRENPLELLEVSAGSDESSGLSGLLQLPDAWFEGLPDANAALADIPGFISGLAIDHSVGPVKMHGGRSHGLARLDSFIKHDLLEYDEKRNHPDEKKTSGLSPWLHFGHVSEVEVVQRAIACQPQGWDLDKITYNKGSSDGFFNGNPNIDSFLDEVITWREVGFHFAHHRDDVDRFDSLPDWALTTMDQHRDDPREWIYTYEELAQSRTHDEIWNAAQTQLREEGIIHNYLRMLWGKKVIEWTPDPETALRYLIDLNNLYAIDGRDPNSYSGIFWCFGRFDRAWQEREIFGKLRFMSSDSTRRKVRMTAYLKRYAQGQGAKGEGAKGEGAKG